MAAAATASAVRPTSRRSNFERSLTHEGVRQTQALDRSADALVGHQFQNGRAEAPGQ